MQAFLRTIILLAAILPVPALAQTQQVNIFSFEDASCNAWIKSAGNKGLRAQYLFWIRGFVSGHNYANQSRQIAVGSLPESDALYQYLDQFCRDNPKSSFVGGVITLVDQLRTPPTATRPAPAKQPPAKVAPAAVTNK